MDNQLFFSEYIEYAMNNAEEPNNKTVTGIPKQIRPQQSEALDNISSFFLIS